MWSFPMPCPPDSMETMPLRQTAGLELSDIAAPCKRGGFFFSLPFYSTGFIFIFLLAPSGANRWTGDIKSSLSSDGVNLYII